MKKRFFFSFSLIQSIRVVFTKKNIKKITDLNFLSHLMVKNKSKKTRAANDYGFSAGAGCFFMPPGLRPSVTRMTDVQSEWA
ncbi:MAG: hypothetical protein KatS3mg032_1155 [Cyclobacteriaceae bacterium]|nr:MAG: hypothetical protein KatS3mg032_1155 [Cyclobacteriaceae bacterium]